MLKWLNGLLVQRPLQASIASPGKYWHAYKVATLLRYCHDPRNTSECVLTVEDDFKEYVSLRIILHSQKHALSSILLGIMTISRTTNRWSAFDPHAKTDGHYKSDN